MMRRIPIIVLLGCCLCGQALAHTLTISQVEVTFGQPGTIAVKVDLDLTLMLGSPELYYEFAAGTPTQRQATIEKLEPQIADGFQLMAGDERIALILQGFTPADASKSDYLDASISKLTSFQFIAVLPAKREPLRLVVPLGAPIDYPVAYTVQIPSAHVSVTRWLDDGEHESDPFDWSDRAPRPGITPAVAVRTGREDLAAAVDSLPWPRQLALYLSLGFHHIVPRGVDHILFVLGLFFLGVTWRKLISQTSVFTVAHATTLFLSTYGIFRLPNRYIEPAIALSIAFIALENVFSPKLGPGRLALVFGFGLVHGLGFATSLSAIPFPKHQFIVALLGFNFGVDGGQLLVIALAFFAVGLYRHRPWFRTRIAVPFSLIIGAIGLFWTEQRIAFYIRN
jgi:hypothetical protein